MTSPNSRSVVMASAYAIGLVLLAAGVVVILRMRCENFGCMGIGVAWFAWAVAGFLPVFVLGLWARWRATAASRVRRWVGWGLSAQVGGGLALAALWGWRTLRF